MARKRNLHESSVHKIKLYGNSQIGYYYLNLFVGSTFQRQTVIIDTGSSVTSFPCTTCQRNDCGNHMDTPFNITASNTSKKISCAAKIYNFQCEACSNYNSACPYSIEYVEGSSMNGYFVEDIVIIGDELMELMQNDQLEHPITQSYIENEKAKFIFGCTTKETNFIKSQEADGILGLGINSNTSNKIPNIIDYTFASHHQEKLEFSLCLSNKNGGFLSIGGYNTPQHIENQTYIIPMTKGSKQYNININGLKIDNEDMGLNNQDFGAGQGTFLDTGTTLFFANSKIYKKIMDKFDTFCSIKENCQGRKHSEKCYYWNNLQFSDVFDFLNTFPKIEFELDNNFKFIWEPKNYFYSDDNLLYCLPFEEIDGRVILGAIFLRNYDVLFDRTDHEIHFTKADCDKQLTDIYLNIQFHNQTENETKTHETFTTVEEVLSQNASKTPDNEAKNQSKLIDFTLNLTNSSEKITFETVDYNNTINTTNQSKDYDVDIDDDNEDDNAINETDSLGSNTSLKYSNISNLSNAYLEMEKDFQRATIGIILVVVISLFILLLILIYISIKRLSAAQKASKRNFDDMQLQNRESNNELASSSEEVSEDKKKSPNISDHA